MQQQNYLPGDEVVLNDGRMGVLYAYTQNSRNPLGRDANRPANWYLLPNNVGTHGAVVVSQPCTVSELDIKRKTGHREGDWPVPAHMLGFEEKQRVYVAAMKDNL